MNFHVITIFPEVFESFLITSLIHKARQDEKISVTLYNPRDRVESKNKQIDDEIYWWWAWLLLMAEPIIQTVEVCVQSIRNKNEKAHVGVILLWPSKTEFSQKLAEEYKEKYTDIIFICWRYEWIDKRFENWCKEIFDTDFTKMSIWQYVTLGWEIPSMICIEAIWRLVPWVIKEEESWKKESYQNGHKRNNIEYPQYTRPQEVRWYKVPDVLLSGNHKLIEEWRDQNTEYIGE